MRVLSVFLMVSFIACALWAADLPLSAGARGPSQLEIYNCGSDGTATKLELAVNIDNPVNKLLNVYFSYYNFTSNLFIDAPDFCSIAPDLSTTCYLKFTVALGNRGNATISGVELIRLRAADPAGINKYSKSLYFNITHTESLVELNVKAKQGEFARLKENVTASIPCEANACCGMLEAKSLLAEATQSNEQSVSSLADCSKAAYTLSVSAVNKAKDAASAVSDNLEACSAAISEYGSASDALNSAKKTISEQSCDTSESGVLLSNAEAKLQTIEARLSSDQYSTISLEAGDVKSLAERAKGNPCKGIISLPTGDGGDGGAGNESTGGSQQGGKACPLPFLIILPVLAAAFACRRSG